MSPTSYLTAPPRGVPATLSTDRGLDQPRSGSQLVVDGDTGRPICPRHVTPLRTCEPPSTSGRQKFATSICRCQPRQTCEPPSTSGRQKVATSICRCQPRQTCEPPS